MSGNSKNHNTPEEGNLKELSPAKETLKKDKKRKKDVSISIFRKRWRKFKTLKRGYYAFLIIVTAYALSFVLPFSAYCLPSHTLVSHICPGDYDILDLQNRI